MTCIHGYDSDMWHVTYDCDSCDSDITLTLTLNKRNMEK